MAVDTAYSLVSNAHEAGFIETEELYAIHDKLPKREIGIFLVFGNPIQMALEAVRGVRLASRTREKIEQNISLAFRGRLARPEDPDGSGGQLALDVTTQFKPMPTVRTRNHRLSIQPMVSDDHA